MKITGFETIPIQGRAMVLKMFTDAGIIGYGEPMNYEHWRVVAQAVDDMAEYLIGKDPLQIEDHWQAMYRSSYSRSMPVLVGALSGIEMAMWDVFGKVVGMPLLKRFEMRRFGYVVCSGTQTTGLSLIINTIGSPFITYYPDRWDVWRGSFLAVYPMRYIHNAGNASQVQRGF